MAFNVGNTKIGSLYLGSTKIASAYIGNVQIFSASPPQPVVYPYLLLQCDGYNNTHPNVSSAWSSSGSTLTPGECVWTQVSTSPNVWKLEITRWAVVANIGVGLPFLFSSNGSPPVGTITNSCSIIGSGNMDVALNGMNCQSMDRMFAGCTGLEFITTIECTRVENVGGMFQGCTNVEYGAVGQYDWFVDYGININNHSGTFTDCGSNTVRGQQDLAQIPVGWGGTLVPASTLMTSTRGRWRSNYDVWTISAGNPDWTAMNGVYLFTESSVSAYAGVSMNRSRIGKFNSLVTTQGQAALYFYPCFMQHTSSAITWAVSTASPNGTLTISQGNTDMPGTLDYSTYGPFSLEFGTYDSAGTVYFCFLVTSSPISSSFNLSTDPYGVLYNSNFKVDAGLRWFK